MTVERLGRIQGKAGILTRLIPLLLSSSIRDDQIVSSEKKRTGSHKGKKVKKGIKSKSRKKVTRK